MGTDVRVPSGNAARSVNTRKNHGTAISHRDEYTYSTANKQASKAITTTKEDDPQSAAIAELKYQLRKYLHPVYQYKPTLIVPEPNAIDKVSIERDMTHLKVGYQQQDEETNNADHQEEETSNKDQQEEDTGNRDQQEEETSNNGQKDEEGTDKKDLQNKETSNSDYQAEEIANTDDDDDDDDQQDGDNSISRYHGILSQRNAKSLLDSPIPSCIGSRSHRQDHTSSSITVDDETETTPRLNLIYYKRREDYYPQKRMMEHRVQEKNNVSPAANDSYGRRQSAK
jgi:hypothetical protein